MKRRAAIVVVACSIVGAFAACGDDDNGTPKATDAGADGGDAQPASEAGDDAGPDAMISGDPCGDLGGLGAMAPWPVAGGCPKRGGLAFVAGPRATAIRFRAPLPAGATSAVIDAQGRIIVATADGRLVIVDVSGNVVDAGPPPPTLDGGDGGDASDGASATDATSDTDASDADAGPFLTGTTPAIGHGGQIVFGESDGHEYAYGDVQGTLAWSRALTGTTLSSPVIGSQGNVYIASNSGTLFALAVDGGAAVWSAPTHDDAGASAPAIGGDQSVYVGSSDGHLYAFDASGTMRWAFAAGAPIVASPIVGIDETVFVGDTSGTVHAIDPTSGAEKWRAAAGAPIVNACASGLDGAVFCSTTDGKVHGYELTGMPRWTYKTNGKTTAPIVDSTGIVYVGSEDAHVYAIATSGLLRYAVSVFAPVRSQPSMAQDGTLVVLTDTEIVGIGP